MCNATIAAPTLWPFPKHQPSTVKLMPTPIHAALAGAFAGVVMPLLWARLGSDSISLVVAFLLVVALPAHAFVVGFGRQTVQGAPSLDAALLKRIAVWFGAAAVAAMLMQAVRAGA